MTRYSKVRKALGDRKRRTKELEEKLNQEKRRGTKASRAVARKRWKESKAKLKMWRKQWRALNSKRWQGCRGVTNEIVQIVAGRAPITSRKRWGLFGNRASAHYMLNRNADAVDFGTANNHGLKNEVARELGGPSEIVDYGNFQIKRGGKTFKVQAIAGTHGTGPHLHYGVERI